MTTVNVEAVWRDREAMHRHSNEIRIQEWLEKLRFIPKFHTFEYTVFDKNGIWETRYRCGNARPELCE